MIWALIVYGCQYDQGSDSLEFNLSGFDYDVEKVVVPMREVSKARGEELFVNVIFVGKSGFTSQPDMSAYAEQVLAVYNHMQAQFGFFPDAWEIVLEPSYVSPGWASKTY